MVFKLCLKLFLLPLKFIWLLVSDNLRMSSWILVAFVAGDLRFGNIDIVVVRVAV